MPSITVPYRIGQTYGVGIDTPSGEARNIAATGIPSQIPNAQGDIITFHMTQISSIEDLQTELGISAEVSGGFGLFSASGRFDYAKSCKIHTSSVFLIAKVSVLQAFSMINAPGIDPFAASLIANGNMTRFQEEFGDMFVRGLQTGGLFFGVIEIITKDETDKQSIQVKVSASYAAFGANGTFDSNFHDALSQRQVNVTCYIEGGDRNKDLPNTIEGMSERVTHYPSELSEGRGVPYAALLDSYSILPLPTPPNYIDLQHQKDVLIECARLRNLEMTVLNDIDYISQHLDEFVEVDNYPLSQFHNDLSEDLNTIAAAASNALNNPKEAKVPVLKRGGPIELPKRKAGAPSSATITVPDVMDEDADRVQIELEALGLRCTTVIDPKMGGEKNFVGTQSPPPGTKVAPGSTVTIYIAPP